MILKGVPYRSQVLHALFRGVANSFTGGYKHVPRLFRIVSETFRIVRKGVPNSLGSFPDNT